MGIYINPKNQCKESWLADNADMLSQGKLTECVDFKNRFPVVLVDNGAFTALAVCDDKNEYNVFMNPDGRPKYWYSVSLEKLKTVLEDFEIQQLVSE